MKRLSNKKYALEPVLRGITFTTFIALIALSTWAFLAFIYG